MKKFITIAAVIAISLMTVSCKNNNKTAEACREKTECCGNHEGNCNHGDGECKGEGHECNHENGECNGEGHECNHENGEQCDKCKNQ